MGSPEKRQGKARTCVNYFRVFLFKKDPFRVRNVAQKRHYNFYVLSIPQTVQNKYRT